MERAPYRGVFSWPSVGLSKNVMDSRCKLSSDNLNVKVIQENIMDELTKVVDQAMGEKCDESQAIFDLGTVVDRYMLWKECFPGIQPFYAVKVYDDPVVITVLNHLGAGFDCASKGELDLVLSCGVDQSNIIYANTIKFPSHLSFAAYNGIALMTVDNEDELRKIKIHSPKAKLLLRMAVKQNGRAEYDLNSKFGCTRERAVKLLQVARSLSLDVIGISFHVGSGCSDSETYVINIEEAHELFKAARVEGFNFTLLDIGGGLFGNEGAEEKIKKMCGPIVEKLANLFPKSSGVRVISEPGRYFIESGLTLATCIVGKRIPEIGVSREISTDEPVERAGIGLSQPRLIQKNHNVGFEYYISESSFGILNLNFYFTESNYDVNPLKKSMNADSYPSRLWGPTCDSGDVICRFIELPELSIGDWLVFKDVGAYSVTVGGTFNAIPQPRIHRVIHQAAWNRLLEYSPKKPK